MNGRVKAMVAGISLMASSAVIAAGLEFLVGTPISYFTDRDRQLLKEAASAVLNDPDASAVREWVNPKNKYSGKVEGRGAYTAADGAPCRKVRISTQAKGIENVATYSVCRTADGDWKLAVGTR